jgi:hypothetical protein
VVEVDGEQFQVFETDVVDRCTAHAERGRRVASKSASA